MLSGYKRSLDTLTWDIALCIILAIVSSAQHSTHAASHLISRACLVNLLCALSFPPRLVRSFAHYSPCSLIYLLFSAALCLCVSPIC